mgnify:CR=1 FL=1
MQAREGSSPSFGTTDTHLFLRLPTARWLYEWLVGPTLGNRGRTRGYPALPVTDEPRPPDLIASGLLGLVTDLRDDIREDIRDVRTELTKVEQRVTARVEAVDVQGKETRAYIETFANGHSKDHEAEAEDRRKTHGEFYDFIRAAELDKARRDGALGILRYGVELVSRHASRLIAIILALAAAAGVATGNIDVSVGQ